MTETVALLAVRSPKLRQTLRDARKAGHAYLVIDGTLIPSTGSPPTGRLRVPGERANAQLKSWRILRKLCCCPWRAGQLAKAIHVLQARETGG